MKITRFAQLGAVAAIATVALAGCSGASSDTSTTSGTISGTLNGSGASTQTVAQSSWATLFQTENPDATVNYDPVGSGSGREQFQAGAVAFAGSDDAFSTDDIDSGTFDSCAADSQIVEFPNYISPIALAYNLPGVDSLQLDAATMGIFAGDITTWDDAEIAATNPGVDLPSTTITPVHRSDKSGTTGNFTDYMSQTAGDVWTYGQVEEWPINGGEGAEKTSGVVSAVQSGEGTIGYADASQIGDLSYALVQVGDEYNAPTAEGAAATLEDSTQQSGRSDTDIVYDLNRTTTASGAYPIMLSSYAIGCQTYPDASTAELVKGYFTTMVSTAGQDAAAESAGSAPLPTSLQTQVQAIIDTITSE